MTNERFAQEIVALTDTLYRVSYSILPEKCDREDAVQSCLEKAWKRRRALREERYLKTWLVRILINECYDIHRRRAREAPRELPERAAPPDADRELHDALMRLPEELRTPSSCTTWMDILFRRLPQSCALHRGRSNPA